MPGQKSNRHISAARLLLSVVLLVFVSACAATAQPVQPRRISNWIKILKTSNDSERRSSAATSLIRSGDPEAIKALRTALAPDAENAVRICVIKAFEVQGNDNAVDLIIQCLDDQHAGIRQTAVSALANIKTEKSVRLLKAAAEDTKASVHLRTQAANILGELRELQAVPTLIILLRDPNQGIRKAARASLELIVPLEFDTIYEWLQWWEERRNKSRVEILEEIIDLQVERIRQQTKTIEEIYVILLDQRKDRNDPSLPIGALKKAPVKVKLHAIKLLTQIVLTGDNEKAEQITAAITDALKDSSATVRTRAAEALSQYDVPKAVAGLIGALEDPIPPVRQAAAESLGKLRARPAVAALCKRLSDNIPDAAAAAAAALGKIGDPTVIEPLVAVLNGDEHAIDVKLLEAASIALTGIVDPKVLPVLLRLLKSENVKIRHAAVRALGRYDPATVIPPLALAARSDPNPQIRIAALDSLAQPDHLDAMPAIVRALSDKDKTVSTQALRSLLLLADGKAARFKATIQMLIQTKRMDFAEKVLDGADEQLTGQPAAKDKIALRYLVAEAFLNAKDWKNADVHFEKLVQMDSDNLEYLKTLIAIKLERTAYGPLIALLKQAHRDKPDQKAYWWQETTKVAQKLYDEGELQKVVELVESLENEDQQLGGPASAIPLRELHNKAKEKIGEAPPADAPD